MKKLLYLAEERLGMLFFGLTVSMVLLGAVGRTLGTPMTWAVDVAQGLFAWACVLGADIALKKKGHIVIDIAVRPMPKSLQTVLSYVWQIVIGIFLGLLVWLGTQLTLVNTPRELGDVGISYAWVTASIPVGALLMLITTLMRLVEFISGKESATLHGRDGEAL